MKMGRRSWNKTMEKEVNNQEQINFEGWTVAHLLAEALNGFNQNGVNHVHKNN